MVPDARNTEQSEIWDQAAGEEVKILPSGRRRLVVQRHATTRLQCDLHLELDRVLELGFHRDVFRESRPDAEKKTHEPLTKVRTE